MKIVDYTYSRRNKNMAKKEKKGDKGTCMACSCPCDMHKEHNHPVGMKCEKCGQEHKEGKTGDCGCK
jgi:hypothetical protein